MLPPGDGPLAPFAPFPPPARRRDPTSRRSPGSGSPSVHLISIKGSFYFLDEGVRFGSVRAAHEAQRSKPSRAPWPLVYCVIHSYPLNPGLWKTDHDRPPIVLAILLTIFVLSF